MRQGELVRSEIRISSSRGQCPRDAANGGSALGTMHVLMPLHPQGGLRCTENLGDSLGGAPTVPRTTSVLLACSVREPCLFPEPTF